MVSDVLVDFEHPVSSSSLNIVAGTWSGKLSGRCNKRSQRTESILVRRQYFGIWDHHPRSFDLRRCVNPALAVVHYLEECTIHLKEARMNCDGLDP